jgi:hypothetical protein
MDATKCALNLILSLCSASSPFFAYFCLHFSALSKHETVIKLFSPPQHIVHGERMGAGDVMNKFFYFYDFFCFLKQKFDFDLRWLSKCCPAA